MARGRAVDNLVPESGLVAWNCTLVKASPLRICALTVTFRWRAAHVGYIAIDDTGKGLVNIERPPTAPSHKTRSLQTHATQQTDRPLLACFHFHRII
jgi:hypothetical protein